MGRDDRSHIIWSWQPAGTFNAALDFLAIAPRAALSQPLSRRLPIRLRNRGFIVRARQRGLLYCADARLVATRPDIFTFSCTGCGGDGRRAVGRNSHDCGKRVGLTVAEQIVSAR